MNKKAKKSNLLSTRVIIDKITPCLDNGRFSARCAVGRPFEIEAVIFCDGHEVLKADILYRAAGDKEWKRSPMDYRGNDLYRGSFIPPEIGPYYYRVEACLDRYETWRFALVKNINAGNAGTIDIQMGIQILDRVNAHDFSKRLEPYSRKFPTGAEIPALLALLDDPLPKSRLREDWTGAVLSPVDLPLTVEPERAAFSSWYEFFPRSRWKDVAERGNLQDALARLDYIAGMGFDTVYLPPIHPIGHTFRKSRNNTLNVTANDPGSPWAIGNEEGGHKAIDPALGNFDDFAALVAKAKTLELSIALDIAFQCSPDHPYVSEHPEWFRRRPDGTIQYAENPPKKYQDIYPFDFECAAWESLWQELKSVFTFWIGKGVSVFRVDNPHTKAFSFWEWVIADIRKDHPEVIFLAEAFTRPAVTAYLAKIGFNQSYTYFTWRRSKAELEAYLKELNSSELKYYFHPNFWPNTPDILPEDLQKGGRPMAVQRLILAATLSSNYGIYGPAYELLEHTPLAAGREEYLNSEKYEVRTWDINREDSLAPLITRVNHIRRTNRSLQTQDGLLFHPVSNDSLIAYTKRQGDNLILTVVNLDPFNAQSGIIDLQIHLLGLDPEKPYQLRDLLSDADYVWNGWKNYVELNPHIIPAHIFSISSKGEAEP